MSRSDRRAPFRRLLSLLVVAGLAVAGCGNSDDSGDGGGDGDGGGSGGAAAGDVPGVLPGEIHFAALGTGANNPTGACVLDCYASGIEAYFAFRNSEGGVHDRDLVLSDVVDDELANNQVRALEILEANDTFAVFSAPQVASGWADLAEAGVPVYSWIVNAAEANGYESIFPVNGVACIDCVSRNYVYGAELAGATTVAALGFGVSEASKDCVASQASSIERWGPDAGLEMAYSNDDLAFGLPNGIGPEVTAMKEAGVDFVLTCFDQNSVRTLAQEMERQGIGDVPIMLPQGYDPTFIGEGAELFEGDVVGVPFRPFESDTEGTAVADYLEWIEETDGVINDVSLSGWVNADLAVRGIEDAGPEFDRASVVEATNELTEYTADGIIAPVDWSRQHEAPTDDDPVSHGPARNCYAYVTVTGGEFELAGDAEEPFFCWDPAEPDWVDPVPTDFD